jgi:phosphate transport system permease protein
MTALDTRPESSDTRLSKPRLPQWAPLLVMAVTAALGVLAWMTGINPALSVLVAVIGYLVVMPVWSAAVESRRAAIDRLATGLVWSAFLVALVPLVWLIVTVVKNGASTINMDFLMFDMRGVLGDEQGGLYHALIGTLLITGLAALISVPVGILAAVYLVEYGAKSRMARVLTFLVDVMTGIPSIVAGLFALALFVLLFGPSIRLGFGGSVALSLLMIPTVVRSTEEMLRLVPADLREASYALGVPKWRTILKVVIPTCVGGIVTGVVLAISRVIGETAPLLVVAGFTSSVNNNPFDGRMMTLPVFIFTEYSKATAKGLSYAWGGALVLIVIVMALNIVARIIGKIFAPKTGR